MEVDAPEEQINLEIAFRPVAPVCHYPIGGRSALCQLGPAAMACVQDALQLPQGLTSYQGDLGHTHSVFLQMHQQFTLVLRV